MYICCYKWGRQLDFDKSFGRSKINWLRKYFPYENGIPFHDVLGRVFAAIDTDVFSRCFSSWINPRNGEWKEIGSFKNGGTQGFDPPGEVLDGNDWTLVLDSID